MTVVFEPVDYLEWIEGRPGAARHDLGSSELVRGRPGDDEVVPPVLAGVDPVEASLESALADRYGVPEEAVLVTAGATHANLLAFAAALADAPRRFLLEAPAYEPLRTTPAALGAAVDRFRRPADGDAVTGAALDRDLLVVPGRFFERPERFRVGAGGSPAETRAALAVLGDVLDSP